VVIALSKDLNTPPIVTLVHYVGARHTLIALTRTTSRELVVAMGVPIEMLGRQNSAMRLYRAAADTDPWFGRGSYWTVSAELVGEFAQRLRETVGDWHSIYVADVDLGVHVEVPFGVFLDSAEVTAHIEGFALAGVQWFSFFVDGPWREQLHRHYVYLGEEPVIARVVS